MTKPKLTRFLARQGDILIEQVDSASVPTDARPVARDGQGRVVLAYGESTGHAHALPRQAALGLGLLCLTVASALLAGATVSAMLRLLLFGLAVALLAGAIGGALAGAFSVAGEAWLLSCSTRRDRLHRVFWHLDAESQEQIREALKNATIVEVPA